MPSAADVDGVGRQVLEHVALAQRLPLRLVGPVGHTELGGGACQVGVVGPDLPHAYVVPTGGQPVELEAYRAPEVVAGLRPVVLLQGAVPDRDRHPLGRVDGRPGLHQRVGAVAVEAYADLLVTEPLERPQRPEPRLGQVARR